MMTIYDYVMGYSDIPYSDSWTMAISQRDVQNLWVQSPCWVDVGTSISTHTHWWTRKHGWLEFTYLKHVPRPKSRNVNNHVQPPPNNQCLWVSIPYWYFVPGFLHLNQPVRSPLSDLTPWVFRCTGCWTHQAHPHEDHREKLGFDAIDDFWWLKRWLLYLLLRLLLSDSANG